MNIMITLWTSYMKIAIGSMRNGRLLSLSACIGLTALSIKYV